MSLYEESGLLCFKITVVRTQRQCMWYFFHTNFICFSGTGENEHSAFLALSYIKLRLIQRKMGLFIYYGTDICSATYHSAFGSQLILEPYLLWVFCFQLGFRQLFIICHGEERHSIWRSLSPCCDIYGCCVSPRAGHGLLSDEITAAGSGYILLLFLPVIKWWCA